MGVGSAYRLVKRVVTLKTVAIIGAGPAGLAAAYELLKYSDEYDVTIYEQEEAVGGYRGHLHFRAELSILAGIDSLRKIPLSKTYGTIFFRFLMMVC